MNNQKTYDLGQVEVVISVDYEDIDEAIQDFFDMPEPYQSIALEEWSNYESHEMTIDGDHDLKESDLEVWRNGGFKHYQTQELLNYMAAQGAIKKGKYVIKIFW